MFSTTSVIKEPYYQWVVTYLNHSPVNQLLKKRHTDDRQKKPAGGGSMITEIALERVLTWWPPIDRELPRFYLYSHTHFGYPFSLQWRSFSLPGFSLYGQHCGRDRLALQLISSPICQEHVVYNSHAVGSHIRRNGWSITFLSQSWKDNINCCSLMRLSNHF